MEYSIPKLIDMNITAYNYCAAGTSPTGSTTPANACLSGNSAANDCNNGLSALEAVNIVCYEGAGNSSINIMCSTGGGNIPTCNSGSMPDNECSNGSGVGSGSDS